MKNTIQNSFSIVTCNMHSKPFSLLDWQTFTLWRLISLEPSPKRYQVLWLKCKGEWYLSCSYPKWHRLTKTGSRIKPARMDCQSSTVSALCHYIQLKDKCLGCYSARGFFLWWMTSDTGLLCLQLGRTDEMLTVYSVSNRSSGNRHHSNFV